MSRWCVVSAAVVCVLILVAVGSPADAQQIDPKTYNGMKWRLVGPFRGGRVLAVTGITQDEPLKGVSMSEAYASTMDLSFDVRGGLLMRQIHHWSALIFVAAIVIHLMRIFFTGAFRKPRELTWLIGLLLLFTSLLEGYLGYSLVDDLLSGMGLAIGYSVLVSLPLVGGPLGLLLFGAPFPGKALFESRMYIAHVFLIPALLAALIGIHLALVAARHHTQFRRDRRHTERRIVGLPLFPLNLATNAVDSPPLPVSTLNMPLSVG